MAYFFKGFGINDIQKPGVSGGQLEVELIFEVDPTDLINLGSNREVNLFLQVDLPCFGSLVTCADFEHSSIDG